MIKITRRQFLSAASALSIPFLLPKFAGAQTADTAAGDTLVCLFLRGGADGLNMVVPYGESDYYSSRPSLALPPPGSGEEAVLDLDGFFGLHPAMSSLHNHFNLGNLALVHAAGLTHGTHSHFEAQDFVESGTAGGMYTSYGWIGRHLDSLGTGNSTLFRAIAMGAQVQKSLRGPVPVTAISEIDKFGLITKGGDAGEMYASTLEDLYLGNNWLDQAAQNTFGAVDQLETADPGQFNPENGAVYPETAFGSVLLEVAQLIKSDVSPEVVCLDLGGWDTHEGQTARLQALLAELSSGLDAFHTDLGTRMDNTVITVMSEFGRRVAENGSAGTDHGHGNCMMLMGGGVVGGQVYGEWPGLLPLQLYGPGDLAITTDYRTVLAEVVAKRLNNLALDQVFPDFQVPEFLGICS